MSLLPVGFGASGDDYTIDDSLRLRSSASAYLNRTPASAGNQKTHTFSAWFKRGDLSSSQFLFTAIQSNAANYWQLWIHSTNQIYLSTLPLVSGGSCFVTTGLFRDPSAWYHIVLQFDTTNATAADRVKLYINGERVTAFASNNISSISLNADGYLNSAVEHNIGNRQPYTNNPYDGYITEVNFIDGQALDPTDFGEYDANGTWKPLAYTGTYGTNGFYLPMTPTTQATGQNTVLYTGNGGTQSINGVGFSPDFVWIKERSSTSSHHLLDTVRGAGKYLNSNNTNAEVNNTTSVSSFDSDGFTTGSSGGTNQNSQTYVAWCWDAGSGSPVSNTVGTIPSTVKANPATGFSIVSYTGNATAGATVGHGLGAAPDMLIVKERTSTSGWVVYTSMTGAGQYLSLHSSAAASSSTTTWNNTTPSSTVFSLSTSGSNNESGQDYIAYCFAEVAGYSSFGSYTGNGSTTGPVVTTGFRPGFVLIKKTNGAANWTILDNTRDPNPDPAKNVLFANLTNTDTTAASGLYTNFTDTGFQPVGAGTDTNTNGGTYIYMAFADTADARFNFDASGNHNNWEANNINSNGESETTYDLMKDTPSLVDENAGNFCTWNPIDKPDPSANSYSRIFSEANLTVAKNGSEGVVNMTTVASFEIPTSGKWYWEIAATTVASAAASRTQIGIMNQAAKFADGADHIYADVAGTYAYAGNGQKVASPGTFAAYGASYTSGVVIGVAVDADNGTIAFYKNGAAQGTAYSGLDMSTGFSPSVGYWGTFTANFGQRPFAYTPPSGFLKLNTFNLPDSTIEKGSDYFNTVLYTGTGSAQTIVNEGQFSPGLVWQKNRAAANHILVDSIRGIYYELYSNLTNAQGGDGNGLVALNSNGFGIGNSSYWGTNGNSYAAWQWRAGSTATNSAGANGASIASTYSANTTSGFSIVGYTGTGSAGTIYHGLGVAPSMVIVKNRTTAIAGAWPVYHTSIGADYYLFLEITDPKSTTSTPFNDTAPTASVFSVDGSNRVNQNTNAMIAYCFAEVPGYSAFGSYEGNANNDGPFIYTGFRPSFVIVKSVDSTSDWLLMDSKRIGFNPDNEYMEVNNANAEGTVNTIDFVSNGFKLRDRTADPNVAETYIYMAFAENPFKNSNAR